MLINVEALPCSVAVSKRLSYQTDPPNGAMKSWVWEHLGNFGLQRPSIQLKCSNFWLSHISAAKFIFACANLWVGVENRSKFIVLQIVPHFGQQKNVFFAFPHATHMTCVVYFFVRQIAFFFGISCTKSCSFLTFFVQHIMPFLCNFSCAKSCLKSCYCNRGR